MRKLLVRLVVAIGAAVMVRMLLQRSERGRAVLRRTGGRAVAARRRGVGSLRGMSYRLRRGRPDPDVDDPVLVDRVRSTLGPMEKRLDLPRVHVMVEDRVVLLHGEVGSPEDAAAIEAAVADVSGVRGVESYLHVGLLPGNTRPSEGRGVRGERSEAWHRLVDAATRAGVPTIDAPRAVRATLGAFADRLPDGERRQLLQHLPQDVRSVLAPPRRQGPAPRRVRTVPQLVAVAVTGAEGVLPPGYAEQVVRAVLGELRLLVPEEVTDVSAVLPRELREFWDTAGAF